MSTLNSFFTTRKPRNTSINREKILTPSGGEIKQQFAVQAPQPVYEVLPKQQAIHATLIKNETRSFAAKKKLSQDNGKSRNSILHYLSPVKKINHTIEETTTPLCEIRQNIPVNHVWNIILEEFDPQSQPNQFEASPTPSPTLEKAELCTVNDMLMSKNRRRKLEQGLQDNTSRRIRIRTVGPSSSSSIDIFCIEDYLFEDTNEDLTRPLRNKHTFRESNAFFMEMLESLVYPE